MLTDGIQLLGTSTAENFTIDSGASLPASDNNLGELFYLTSGSIGLYVYDGSDWVKAGSDELTSSSIASALGYTPAALSGGKLLASQVPAIAISDTFVVASQAAMLALSSAEIGDVAVRTDLNKSFILKTTGPSTLANWQELLTPVSAVTSVNGQTGAVTLTLGDTLPSQTGNNGKYLTTDGSVTSWGTVSVSLPSTVTTSPIFNGQASTNTTVAGVQVGRNGGGSSNDSQILLTTPTAATNQKLTRIQTSTGGGNNGDFIIDLLDDGYTSATQWLRLVRSGTTPTSLTLTATAINLTGAVTGTSFAGTHTGTGTGLTALNASNLASGTVGTARLGSGTADGTTYLRGDGTWASVSGGNTLTATGALTINGTTTGVGAGVAASTAILTFTNGTAALNERLSYIQTLTNGSVIWSMANDAAAAATAFFRADRSANTATNITLTGTAITLTGAVTGTSFTGTGTGLTALNASNLASGTVGTARLGTGTASGTTYLRGDGTWATPSTGVSSLAATASVNFTAANITAGGVYSAVSGGVPYLAFANAAAGTNIKGSYFSVENDGTINLFLINDNATGNVPVIKIARSGTTVSLFTFTGTAFNFAGMTGGIQLNGSAGTAGQVLTSQGAAAAPTWTSPSAGALTSTYVGVGSGSNLLTGSAALAFNSTTNVLTLGTSITTPAIIQAPDLSSGSTASSSLTVRGGHGSSANVNAGGLFLRGGNYTSTSNALPGPVTLQGGDYTGSGTSVGGNTFINGGLSNSSPGGYIALQTSPSTGAAVVERMRVSAAGVITTGAATSVDFGGRYTELASAVTFAATLAIDASLSNVYSTTLTANVTSMTFTNLPATGRAYNITLMLLQDGTGNRTVVWPTGIKWAGGTAPTLSGANKMDIITLMTTTGGAGTPTWYGFVGGLNF